MSKATTEIGIAREQYAREHAATDPRPSRFAEEGATYRAWATRADAWALSRMTPRRAEIVETLPDGAFWYHPANTPVSGDALARSSRPRVGTLWERASR